MAARRPSGKRFPSELQHAIAAAQDHKAIDVVVLDLRPADGFTDYFLICSGQNARQMHAISEAVQDALGETGAKPALVEGDDRAGWILLDYFDFIVHIFSPDARAFYALERLWGSARRFELADAR